MPNAQSLLEPPKSTHARLLVVDDSATIRSFLEQRLAVAPLFAEVVCAKDGSEALKLIIEEPFNCVICDLSMPGLDGFALLRQLRKRFSLLELPVLILTVAERTQDKVAGFAAGASDFLVKPVAEDELIARVQTHVSLSRLHQQLQLLVETDTLTGCGNRRMFMRALQRELGRAGRSERGFGLLLLDVDHFKKVNDQLGHQAGDVALQELGSVLQQMARQYDTVARIGGEEFAVLLPETSSRDLRAIAERYRLFIERAVPGKSAGVKKFSVSIGATIGPIDDDESGDKLYAQADRALYDAKNRGRNQVVFADGAMPVAIAGGKSS